MGLFAILSSTMSKNPVLPLLAESIGTPKSLMGFVAAASTIPGIIISFPAGGLSDVLGRKKLILLSSVIFASAPFLYLLIQWPWQLMLIRFYHGFATAIFVPVATAAIAESFPHSKAEKISLFSAATVVGRSAAPLLGGFILFVTNSNYHQLYVAVGIAGAIALFLALTLFHRESLPHRRNVSLSNETGKSFSTVLPEWRKIVADTKILVVSMVEATQYYTFGAFEFFLILYAQSLGLDTLQITVISWSQLATVMFAKPFFGRLSDRFGRRVPIVSGLILGGVSLLVTPFVKSFLVLILSVAYGLGFSLVTSSTAALVSDYTKRELYGSAIGFLNTIRDIGQASGPIITGLILTTMLGYFGSFTALSAVLLVSSVVFFIKTIKTRGKA